jgi:acetylornithine deacetylase/succinyl-diaminopimelate desuccinylase-like protein
MDVITMKKMTPYPVHCSALSLAFAVGFTVSSAPVALAQPARPLQDALKDRAVQAAMADVDTRGPEAARLLATLGAIVSPSGREHARAEEVARRMRAIGLNRVTVDAAPNAVGMIPGRSGRALVFVSTLDDLADVAEHQKAAAAPPHVEGSRVVGPGTNTSATTAAMLTAAGALVKAGFTPEHDLVFAAVAQEETGLAGMHALYREWRDRAIGFVDILGDGSSISYGAIQVHWWK